MGAYLVRRVLAALVVLVGVSMVVFIVVRVIPGDPVQLMYGDTVPKAMLEQARADLGLDRPYVVQYAVFIRQLARGDLGESFRYRRPVLEIVMERLPATGQLALTAFAISLLIGVPAGVLSAVKRNGVLDNLVMLLVIIGQSVPTFWLGIMLIIVFAVTLHWLPTSGADGPLNIVLPAVTLASFLIALTARLVRSCMLEVLSQDYVRTARSKGLGEFAVIVGHALRNSLIPVVTVLGIQIGGLLGGAVITETVFAWPGVGFLAITAISQRDYNLVQAVVLLSAVVFVVINLLVDLTYSWLDPRIRISG